MATRSLGLVAAASALLIAASTDAAPDPRAAAVQMRPLTSPAAVTVAGRLRIAYELVIRGAPGQLPTPVSVTIEGDRSRPPLARFSGDALRQRIGALPDGGGLIIYIEADAPRGVRPARVNARVVLRGDRSPTLSVRDVQSSLQGTPVMLAPPLGDGRWVAVHAPSWPRGHRRVLTGVGAETHLPGRFAIDFVGVDALGRTSHGDPDRPSDAVGYGAPVLAGADAVVAAVQDGVAEASSIRDNPQHPGTAAAGNYVALDLGGGRFVFYEHLRPGSLRVRAGERVHAGQQLGELGYSGDSTGPHLHMHVADGPDPMAAEGLPFVLRSFRELGRYERLEDLGRTTWRMRSRAVRREWPDYNVVVQFRD